MPDPERVARNSRIEIAASALGFLRVTLFGQLDSASDATTLYDAVQEELRAHGAKPVRLLVDLSNFVEVSLGARWALAMCLKQRCGLADRVACVGLSARLELVANIIIRASGQQNIRIFHDHLEAERWLRSERSPHGPEAQPLQR